MNSLTDQIHNKQKEINVLKGELYDLKRNMQNSNFNDNDELVTIVRKVTYFEEVVLTKKNFDDLNRDLKSLDADEYCERLNDLAYRMNDAMVYENVPDYYTAFKGDITSATDDMLSLTNPEWKEYNDCDTGIPLFKKSFVDCLVGTF